ncbi:MAG: hypothetical protein QOH59_1858 [Gemmatimonadales bacterium]|jgi:hypothetical protein|nr:hypothetical protein [Gemmatimonadales bacterium]
MWHARSARRYEIRVAPAAANYLTRDETGAPRGDDRLGSSYNPPVPGVRFCNS